MTLINQVNALSRDEFFELFEHCCQLKRYYYAVFCAKDDLMHQVEDVAKHHKKLERARADLDEFKNMSTRRAVLGKENAEQLGL